MDAIIEDFNGEVVIEDVVVIAEEHTVHEFDKKVFKAKNLLITIKLGKS